MKGGITSGVVYPGAILELAKRYRFRSIGGTSAGAIAAAVVAAAEYGRQDDSFRAVADLPYTLSASERGRPFMLQLFAPDVSTRPLFEAAIGFIRWGPFRAARNALRWLWHFPLLAAVVAAISAGLTLFGSAAPHVAVGGVSAALVILLVGVGAEVFLAVRGLARNNFGLCRLGPDVGTPSEPALTAWLHQQIQNIAGKSGSGPLTFADLWGASPVSDQPTQPEREQRAKQVNALSRDPQERKIDLQVMTTNLSHGRPVRLPVPLQKHRDRLEDGGGLLFDPQELRHFFPSEVIDHLVLHGDEPSAETQTHLTREAPGRALRHFPIGAELPVVVATRMSLSFPILIAAVPLWQLDYRSDPETPRLRSVIFSDGGITSNFPVHFFDSPLPRRPTFALNLIGFGRGEKPDPKNPCAAVRGPAGVAGQAEEYWADIDDTFGFLTAIKDALQNWRDNAQGRLPGFRERIAHIKLDRGEGGLNLTMKSEKIIELGNRGACAGKILVEHFSGDASAEPVATQWWNDHRFARYRTTMSLMERFLSAYKRGYVADVDPVTTPYPDRIVQGTFDGHYAFNSEDRRRAAQTATETYLDLVAVATGDQSLDDANVPLPRSALRTVPPV